MSTNSAATANVLEIIHGVNQRCKMHCRVTQLNNQSLDVEVNQKQIGQVILDKVLEKLGILEVDYFGLQYTGTKGEELWLNLRNRLCDQDIQYIRGYYYLSLRVKFFVALNFVQQEPTKELFYVQIRDVLSKGTISLAEPNCDEAKLARIVACIAQTEYGDQNALYPNISYPEIIRQFCPGVEPKSALINQIDSEHSKLIGMPRVSARNFVLKEISTVRGYGVEEHKTINAQGADTNFRVGTDGIVLQDCKTKAERVIPYSQVSLATHKEKNVHIVLLDDAGEQQSDECFKLISAKAAVALYRCITEMHSFYRCDTVGSNVHSQYSRDFKGSFVSIFNENSDFGKRYIFDVQRTSREAYDLVRRKLYAKSSSPTGSPQHYWPHAAELLDNDVNGNLDGNHENEATGEISLEERNKNLQMEIKHLKQRLELVEESLLCCICINNRVCIVLCPCGHMVCDCCSERIDNCPQCRSTFDSFQKVFHSFGLDSDKISKQEQIV